MAGKIIVDTLQTESSFLQMNVGTTRIATMNASGIYSNTGTKMIGYDGTLGVATIANTAINGVITASQLAPSLNLATNNVQVASIQSATGTPAITFAANGQITTANTPFILTGGQIQFPATQIASGDGNTLDDYEEGTWTPVFTAAGTAPTGVTYSAQVGRYTKIGNSVTVWGNVVLSSKGTGGVGEVRITGLPFVSENVNNLYIRGAGDIGGSSTWGTSRTQITFSTIPNDTYVAMIESGSGQGLSNPTWANQTNSSSYTFTITYRTA